MSFLFGPYPLTKEDEGNMNEASSSSSSALATHARAPTAEQLFAVTHLTVGGSRRSGNGSQSSGARGKSRGKATPGTKEFSKGFSNDAPFRWFNVPQSRTEQFRTIETVKPQAFLTTSTVAETAVGVFFIFNQVADASSYSGIFDQYCIRMIEVLIEPQVTEVTTVATDVGQYITVVDIDDANTPTAYTDLVAYPTAISSNGTISHYHRWVPTIAYAVYSGAFTSFASAENQWVDMASPNVQHYGIKGVAGAATVSQKYGYTTRFHIALRARH